LVAPRGTPEPIIRRLNMEVNAVLSSPEVGDRIRKQGVETDPGTPDDLAKYIKEEMARFQTLVDAIKLKL
jgi:tripartite-type tricarboxylate transporter receptor subunit TctC